MRRGCEKSGNKGCWARNSAREIVREKRGESVNRRGVARKKGLGKYERGIVPGEVSFWA